MKMKKVIATLLSLCMMTSGVFAGELGDVDMDGVITASDAGYTLQYVLNSNAFAEGEFDIESAKVIAGEITAENSAFIYQKALDGNFKFPIEGQSEETTGVITEETTETTSTVTEETTETTSTVTEETTTETTSTVTEETTTETTSAVTEETTTETTSAVTEETTTETTSAVTEETTETTTNYVVDWNFSSNEFSGLGTVTATTSINGLTIVAGQKTLSLIDDFASSDYTKAFKLGGSGSTSGDCLSFDVLGKCTIQVTAKSGNDVDVRTLVLATSTGEVTQFSANPTPQMQSYTYTGGAETMYLYSKASGINVYEIKIIYGDVVVPTPDTTTESTTSDQTETSTGSGETTEPTTADPSNAVRSFSALKSAISAAESNGGGTVYVQGIIECDGQIKLTKSNAKVTVIGIDNADGTGTRLDFAKFRDTRNGTGEAGTGIYITGSNYNFNNLIIENAPDCGIRIKGSSAGNCKLENLVLRYNNNSGLSITAGGSNNTMINIDSYRNCDLVQKAGGDADGFSVKLAAGGGNTFYGCRAWENGDDGWDSYDRSGNIPDLSYEESACWHNGETEIFTGEYDWRVGNPLDKNLIYVKAIIASDPTFEDKYNNGEITTWPKLTLNYFGMSRSYNSMYQDWGGNPNGFKMGSAESTSKEYKSLKNCLAFGHAAKGFDQNNGSCTFDLTNTVGFDNERNYVMEKMTCKSAVNAKDFDGKNANSLPSRMTLITPSADEQAAIRAEVEAKVKLIIDAVYSDKIPGEVFFDIYS